MIDLLTPDGLPWADGGARPEPEKAKMKKFFCANPAALVGQEHTELMDSTGFAVPAYEELAGLLRRWLERVTVELTPRVSDAGTWVEDAAVEDAEGVMEEPTLRVLDAGTWVEDAAVEDAEGSGASEEQLEAGGERDHQSTLGGEKSLGIHEEEAAPGDSMATLIEQELGDASTGGFKHEVPEVSETHAGAAGFDRVAPVSATLPKVVGFDAVADEKKGKAEGAAASAKATGDVVVVIEEGGPGGVRPQMGLEQAAAVVPEVELECSVVSWLMW
ncbi:hypothetical protein HDU96_002106 [Phlyctochytrium bullatum]|nr:hypothetical protein HDU96_002106 [Phlyctochytrium bullatum]